MIYIMLYTVLHVTSSNNYVTSIISPGFIIQYDTQSRNFSAV